jgi:hypothetical protein
VKKGKIYGLKAWHQSLAIEKTTVDFLFNVCAPGPLNSNEKSLKIHTQVEFREAFSDHPVLVVNHLGFLDHDLDDIGRERLFFDGKRTARVIAVNVDVELQKAN